MVVKASLSDAIKELGHVEDELLKLMELKAVSPGGFRSYIPFLSSSLHPSTSRRNALERHMADLTVQIGILFFILFLSALLF